MNKRAGSQTVVINNHVHIISNAAVVGKKEGEGPLGNSFDMIVSDDKMGQKSWDLAEGVFQKTALEIALKKASLKNDDIDYILAGDLQNQCVATHYGLRLANIPFLGLYGACSTMIESVSIATMLVSGGFANKTACVTSSHFCSAEKQFRTPLEYGGQRTPTAQWTATAAGAVILCTDGTGPEVTHITTGKIIDKGITDISNMGAAMAPAAADTLIAHFKDTKHTPDNYDLIITGDLGVIGSDILRDLMRKEGYIINNHIDCGTMLYDLKKQDVHAGASGCGCCASVLCGYFLNEMKKDKFKNILVAATGALMNPQTILQGESIPSISHAVAISNTR